MDDGSLIISCQIIEKTEADSITGYNPLIAINNGEKQWEAKLPLVYRRFQAGNAFVQRRQYL